MEEQKAPEATYYPPGWDNNPSSWHQRLPIVGLALIGLLIASYLGAFQLDLITAVWEPFFGNGTREVLTSGVSTILPIPDGVLGALAYLVDAVTGVIGGRDRWRTMPWIVIIFGIAVGPLGAVSITLVIFQPVLFDSWCTLCLCSALISILMIGPAMDEFLASLQYLKRVSKHGDSVWQAFLGQKNPNYDHQSASLEVN
ncbi:MAG: vitamin K epoxide reductase family protein [Anaerolineae bacterium]|nr:vitamin K epoxide reductase family protein [Anaerolineae bacterium]